MKKGKESSL